MLILLLAVLKTKRHRVIIREGNLVSLLSYTFANIHGSCSDTSSASTHHGNLLHISIDSVSCTSYGHNLTKVLSTRGDWFLNCTFGMLFPDNRLCRIFGRGPLTPNITCLVWSVPWASWTFIYWSRRRWGLAKVCLLILCPNYLLVI